MKMFIDFIMAVALVLIFAALAISLHLPAWVGAVVGGSFIFVVLELRQTM